MKVKKFVAGDMRTALRNVRDELGPDAVILSNRTVNDQVEILAVMDYDEGLINDDISENQRQSGSESAADYYEQAAAERYKQDQLRRTQQTRITEQPQAEDSRDEGLRDDELRNESQAAGLFQSVPQNNHGMHEMKSELKSLRAMMENQQALSEWGNVAQKHPLRIPLYKRFTEMGLSQDVCKYLVKGLDDLTDIDHAMKAALKQLVHQLPIAEDDIVNQGGVYAMVGPTGVGKTTTIAKLAARFAMRHGQRHVALVSTDNYRIGAHDMVIS